MPVASPGQADLTPHPRSIIWATDIDVLPASRVVERRIDHLVIRCPSNANHWWGNFLLFDDPPGLGDGQRWEQIFVAEFPDARHRAFGWDSPVGALGAAQSELVDAGFELERTVGLIAAPDEMRAHPRANQEVAVRALDPHAGRDSELWDAVLELQVAGRDAAVDEPTHRDFSRSWLGDQRDLFLAGRGGWYVALAADGEVVGSCGVVVTAGRGRFRAVDTAQAHRRRGICSRLVVEAARDTVKRFGAEQLVIVADADYHALGLYESLGFLPRERAAAVLRPPT